MNKKKVLLIAGGGTLGSYTSPELLKLGYQVDVLDRLPMTSLNRNLRYIQSDVNDEVLRALFSENRYDAIVDFIHYPKPELYRARADLLLANTDQLVFLSSYRIYADSKTPITEESPRLLETIDDPIFLADEDYAIPKAHNEDYLRSTGKTNFTMIRPLISFSHFRLDLITSGAHLLLPRAKAGKKLLLPASCRYQVGGVGWAGNVGRLIAHLIGKDAALGEAFTMGTCENPLWNDVAEYYGDLIGLQCDWVDDETFFKYSTDGSYMSRCILKYDRAYSRRIDNSKVLRVTGLDRNDYVPVYSALVDELNLLAARPDLVDRMVNTDYARKINAQMDAYYNK